MTNFQLSNPPKYAVLTSHYDLARAMDVFSSFSDSVQFFIFPDISRPRMISLQTYQVIAVLSARYFDNEL